MFWLLDVMNAGEYRRGYKNGTSTETGNTRHTRRRQTKQKHNTICVWHHYMQTNTYNVNKTRTLLQTNTYNVNKTRTLLQTNTYNVNKTRTLLQKTEGKDEPKIALCSNRNCWIMSGHIAMQRSTTNHSWLNERLLIGVIVLSLSNRTSFWWEVFFVAWNKDYIVYTRMFLWVKW
jgi:hypothetical protein